MNFYVVLIAAAIGALGGWLAASDHYDAKQLEGERAAVAKYRDEVTRGNTSSAQLAQAETAIQIKTVERIKYVPKVTTGRRCLEPAAVGLLNGSGAIGLPATAGQPVAADAAAPAASDADVAGWIVSANGNYDTCAARLNELIDYEEAKP